MGIQKLRRIKEVFTRLELEVKYLEHVAVITSEDASKTRGFELKQGVKALLFTNDKEYVIVDVPADEKVDVKKLANFVGWEKKNIRMASPDEVLEVTGCEIGAVPPFGHKDKLRILFDGKIFENRESVFNIGLRTNSAVVKASYLRRAFNFVGAEEGDFVKEKV
ncbi:MAG: YbaK/EbsC family protein [Nanoarchaeota archaeon]